MLMSPIIAMLHDEVHDRWHPITFMPSPLFNGDLGLVRFKSGGHHTKGFPSREEALDWCDKTIEGEGDDKLVGYNRCLDKAFLWDGEGIPAMVVFFAEDSGKIVPIMG